MTLNDPVRRPAADSAATPRSTPAASKPAASKVRTVKAAAPKTAAAKAAAPKTAAPKTAAPKTVAKAAPAKVAVKKVAVKKAAVKKAAAPRTAAVKGAPPKTAGTKTAGAVIAAVMVAPKAAAAKTAAVKSAAASKAAVVKTPAPRARRTAAAVTPEPTEVTPALAAAATAPRRAVWADLREADATVDALLTSDALLVVPQRRTTGRLGSLRALSTRLSRQPAGRAERVRLQSLRTTPLDALRGRTDVRTLPWSELSRAVLTADGHGWSLELTRAAGSPLRLSSGPGAPAAEEIRAQLTALGAPIVDAAA